MVEENQHSKFISELFKQINTYITTTKSAPVASYSSPTTLKKEIQDRTHFNGKSLIEILEDIQFYLDNTVNTGHSQFFNQLFSGRNIASLAGDWITSLTNTSMYTYEMAPVASLLENMLLEKLNTFIGYDAVDGTFTTGGSNANLLAMLSARHYKNESSKTTGLFGEKPLVAFVSKDAHYSFLKAANIMGLGTQHVISIPTNENHEMDIDILSAEIERSIKNGQQPFFIGLTAGTTVWGSFDSIEKIYPISKKHNLWLHVDGSLGGPALLSKAQRDRLNGIELSDSFSMDAHKFMGIPLICSLFMVNKRDAFLTSLSDVQDGGYLFHDKENEDCYYLGPKSFQSGRRVDVLKLWLSWLHFGDKGYESRINHCVELSAYAADIIETHPNLCLVAPQQFVNVCFQYIPRKSHLSINDFNKELRTQLLKRGLSMVNYVQTNEITFIRLILVNPDCTRHDIQTFFDNILNCALDLENNN